MHPHLLTLPFLGMGFVAILVVTALVVRGRLIDRFGHAVGVGLAMGGGTVVASIAALAGWVPWTGTWAITSYGVCLLAAVGLAAWSLRRLGRDPRLRPEGRPLPVADLVLVALIAGLAGARARFVWENPGRFRDAEGSWRWASMLDLDQGGMVWYGGLLAGILAVAVFAWRRRLPHLDLADAVAAPIALGLGLGRIGCFLNGCCHGKVCDLPWAVHFPRHPLDGRHPAQLYEALAMLGLGGLLWWLRRRQLAAGEPRRPAAGTLGGLFLIAYGAWRCFNETLRDDYRHEGTLNDLGGIILTNSQITSLWLLIGGCVLVTWASQRRHKDQPA